MSDTVTVIQADRERAAALNIWTEEQRLEVLLGRLDNNSNVQLLARHRIAHEPKAELRLAEVVLLLDEILECPAFYGIGFGLLGKLKTVRLTASLPTPPEQTP
jgi:hypothetical protein